MFSLLLLLGLGCSAGQADNGTAIVPNTPEPSTTVSGSSPTGSTGDTGQGEEPTPTNWEGLYPAQTFDCSTLPDPPFMSNIVAGTVTQEDFIFDTHGYAISNNHSDLVVRQTYDGVVTPISAELPARPIDILPNGTVIAIDSYGTIHEIDSVSGATSPVFSTGAAPGGMDVDSMGYVYVSFLGTRAVHVYDSATWTLVGEAPGDPNQASYGLGLSPDEQKLYVGEYASTDEIFEWDVNAGSIGPRSLFTHLGRAGIGGIATDICGNIYVINVFSCFLSRISPDGEVTVIDRVNTNGPGCASLEFGSGLGGWSATSLFISSYTNLIEYDVGVPGRRR